MIMTSNADHRSIFDLCPNDEALLGLREVNTVPRQPVNTEPASHAKNVSDVMKTVPPLVSIFQTEHYKLDWHRFNLRQKLAGLPPVTVEEFEKRTGAGDMSSISGSESDSDEEKSNSDGGGSGGGGTSSNVTGTDNESSAETSCRLSSKMVFQNSAGQYVSVYRCILRGKLDAEHDAGPSLIAINLSNTEADDQEEEVPGAVPAEDAPRETQPKNKRKKKTQSKKQVEETVDEPWEYGLRDALFTACKVGDVDTLSGLLESLGETAESTEQLVTNPSVVPSPPTLLTKPIDSSGFTLLHVASAAAQKSVVRLLLHEGADPACRDNKGQTPYIVAPDKDTRNVFRKYMGENPDKYDYSKAQVPGPLTAEIESKMMEKKKAQKASRRQREKEQKEEKRKQELEAEEKKRFASLTDREKRALAAEKRLAEQVAASGVGVSNIKRCWSCGESLIGKIPFQYLEYSFCTPHCVQAHRKGNAPPGKS
ncbi:hypothetical protein F2P81_021239 [Scophthalmus maximus]|uniref:Vms1-associating treble clef domain-containing protein n=1 Tax=Scophthalmus maximus TaxID=52904 RepID=A0A6A4S597_SCOMX|nr:hypothetical protein F2P81_021239 [Scophthalmus maximus]